MMFDAYLLRIACQRGARGGWGGLQVDDRGAVEDVPVQNVFGNDPEENPIARSTGSRYSAFTPFGVNGGFYCARIGYAWTAVRQRGPAAPPAAGPAGGAAQAGYLSAE